MMGIMNMMAIMMAVNTLSQSDVNAMTGKRRNSIQYMM
jgi:hypothetical protein